MLQKSCLLIRVLYLEKLIELRAGNLEGRWNDSNWCEDGFVVGPYEEYEADVVEEKHEERLNPRLHHVNAQLVYISVPAPTIIRNVLIFFDGVVLLNNYHSIMPLMKTTGMTRIRERSD